MKRQIIVTVTTGLTALAVTGCLEVTCGGVLTLASGELTDRITGTTIDLAGTECSFDSSAQGTSTSAGDLVPATGQIVIFNNTAKIVFKAVVDQSGKDKYQSAFPGRIR